MVKPRVAKGVKGSRKEYRTPMHVTTDSVFSSRMRGWHRRPRLRPGKRQQQGGYRCLRLLLRGPVLRTPGSGPAPSTPVPPTPAAVITLTQRTSEATDAPGTTAIDSCHNCSFQDSKNKGSRSGVKGAKSLVEGNSETKDYWEFDEERHAWVLVHLRPRKRLFAPVGEDCPFDSNEVEPERITEWRCKGKVSVHRDNWQETPYQRISSKSWFGKTWFFPKGRVSPDQAQLCAAAANPSDGNLRAMQRFIEQAGDSQARTRKAREILELTKDLVKPAREDRKGRRIRHSLSFVAMGTQRWVRSTKKEELTMSDSQQRTLTCQTSGKMTVF